MVKTARKPAQAGERKSLGPHYKTLSLDQLRIDGGTQARVCLHEPTVQEYCELYQAGEELPPIRAVFDGVEYWLWEGFHRYHALRRAGIATARVHVENGTQRDAILLACGANAEHGLKRTNADKRRAVELLLQDDVWSKKSDRWIAEQCRVSDHLVANVRQQQTECQVRVLAPEQTREGKDGKTYKTPARPAADDRQQQVRDFFAEKNPDDATRQYRDTFDVESLDSQPGQVKPESSVLRDQGGRPIPERFRAHQDAAAQIIALARELASIRTRLAECTGPGFEFLEPDIAPALEMLTELREVIRSKRFACECPQCLGALNECSRCDGYGWLPEARIGTLSDDEKRKLGWEV